MSGDGVGLGQMRGVLLFGGPDLSRHDETKIYELATQVGQHSLMARSVDVIKVTTRCFSRSLRVEKAR